MNWAIMIILTLIILDLMGSAMKHGKVVKHIFWFDLAGHAVLLVLLYFGGVFSG